MIKNKEELFGDYKKGFLTKVLWLLSRQTYYFSKQVIFTLLYLFSLAASGGQFKEPIVVCLLLAVIFKSSSTFSEEISASKYLEYKEYQNQSLRFFPLNSIAK